MPKKILRVGEVTRYLHRLLEDDRLLQDISVLGEVTDLSRAASGHHYFTLKDGAGQLPCVMFRSQATQQRSEIAALAQGINLVAEGAMSIYESRGIYQLTVKRIRVQGAGAGRLRFEQLRKQLEADGLFAQERKRPLPAHPKCLALVTSPESDAYHDVIRRLSGQWPRVKVVVAGVSVQGEQAPAEITLALNIVNRMTDADAILLVRGGGSDDELAWFNDERVARAIFASKIPVITGIGHEKDGTIADFVADHAAPTPTAAAAVSVPDGFALRGRCGQLQSQLTANMKRGLYARSSSLIHTERALVRASPTNRIRMRRQRVDEMWDRLVKTTRSDVDLRRRKLDALSRQVQALDPLSILSRGYALITDTDSGEVISSVDTAVPGRNVSARVKDGSFLATVRPGS